jgi:deoxyribonuclease-4
LLDAVGDFFDAGICLDTQHLWAAGFDWRGDGIDRLLEQVETACGLQRLACIHLNDSKSHLGSRSDRHANIGKGSIGKQAFVELLLREELGGVPKILETPGSSEIRKKELKSLRRSCLQELRRASPQSIGSKG